MARGQLQRPVATYPADLSTGVPIPYIGVSTNLQSFGLSHNPQRSQDEVSVFEEAIRTRVNAVLTFQNCNVDAIPSALAKIVAAGKRPIVTYAPTDLAGVLAGTYDAQIGVWARALAGVGAVRFAHEMNGNWYIWASAYGAANYIALWNYTRAVWRAAETAAGYPHVPWIWCPNVSGGGAIPFDAYYPGDAACEWVGLDGYSTKTTAFPSFQTLFDADITDLQALSTHPILIGETSIEGSSPNKSAWISAMFTYLATRPRVKGLMFWHHDNENPFVGYRIDTSPAAEAYRAGLAAWAPGVAP